jgi:hypothetical protein
VILEKKTWAKEEGQEENKRGMGKDARTQGQVYCTLQIPIYTIKQRY